MTIHPRYTWAVEHMRIQPDDHVLEIGCGTGIAAGLVAERLQSGTITAIDRSQPMIEKAVARNAVYSDNDKAVFLHTSIEDLSAVSGRYDKIFAFNVSLFWITPGKSLEVIASLLQPQGRLYVFHQPPFDGKVVPIAEQTCAMLEKHKFSVLAVDYQAMQPAATSCVTAQALRRYH